MGSPDPMDARRRLQEMFGEILPGGDAQYAGRWNTVAGEEPARGGDLVLDLRNRRLKLYGAASGDSRDPGLQLWREGLRSCGEFYTKLTVYARPGREMAWMTAGFLREGFIAGYFEDGEDAQIWVAFGDDRRAEAPRDGLHDETVKLAASKPIVTAKPAAGFRSRPATVDDAAAIAELMDATFDDYPTPITTGIIREQIETVSNVFRVMLDENGRVVASASAEIDHDRRSAEMTDCATRPDQRGAGHMAALLEALAVDVKRDLGITDLYTLARADEVGMNCVFGKLGYNYTGRLVNNCRMPNGWESMNIWCRSTAGS